MRLTPVIRISLGLVSLTVSLLLLGKMIGLAPDQTRAVLESRINLSEALAVQFTSAVQQDNTSLLGDILVAMVDRNVDVESAAVRETGGRLLAEAGDHLAHWKSSKNGKSTTTHVQIPIFRGTQRWGTAEISFTPIWRSNFTSGFKNSYLSLILFVGFAGFGGYFLLIKRTLRELDPSSVVPGRVRAAFDVLEEGVLILDENEFVVLANSSFAEFTEKSPSQLIGFKGSELGWKRVDSKFSREQLPWMQVLKGENSILGSRLVMERGERPPVTFVVNAAPVLDGKGNRRGVLVTFDNITELEEKNRELNLVVDQLQLTTEEVQEQNKELEFLANHDPMTQLLNRRAFNRDYHQMFHYAQKHDVNLTCIMCDIDHFKAVNDNYGHATGDKVIIMVAGLLKKYFQEEDLLGRYGGEEFCIAMPNIELKQAAGIANRVRQAIKEDLTTGIQISMSFGVATFNTTCHEPDELLNQADKALYVAKESGRNCVVCWGNEEITGFTSVSDGTESVEPTDKGVTRSEGREKTKENMDEMRRLVIRLKKTEQLAEKRAQELKHYAAYDAYSGLPTRVLFYDRVSQALLRADRYKCFVVVLSLSVDAVQRVNETLGYKEGDLLFKEVATRLTEELRAVDSVAQLDEATQPTVGRLGQEEIGVLLTDLQDVHAITWIVKRILSSFKTPFKVDGNDIYATTNIGIAVSSHDGESPDVLLRNATAAKSYARKKLGENKYYYYSESINAVSIQHLNLEKQLDRAVTNDEFKLFYQAKIDAKTGTISGMEALIRWFHPENGLIPPDQFIPVAEYSGMIEVIGDWVIKAACKQLRIWCDLGFENCNVAVNISNRQFRQHNLVSRVREILKEYSLPPRLLTLEVTESSMMENIGNSLDILQQLRQLGVGIALDDFGTGYSSLGYLKNFPVSHVKIDRSFVADIETNHKDAVLVKSIINMAHGMGLKVTAEGVENENQIGYLLSYGCDELQGFYFSKGLPGKDATELLITGLGDKGVLWKNRKSV
ncbi:MAG: diguanylate cyclase (GGDEF)-like protein [Desulforhopalus sp.]|jgi:diguanylate cyclase (GGDEF)-like protein